MPTSMTPYGPLARPLTPEEAAIVEEATRLAEWKVRALGIPEQAACLLYAGAVVAAAHKQGRRLVLQAGTALWPRVRPEQDDGVSSTHFGYEWDPPKVAKYIAMGVMPEMHAWAGDPETQDLVDLTTGHFPAQCKALIGADWPGDRPPRFWWGPAAALPEDVVYKANRDATMLAMRLLADLRR